jgi:hypothetical protein
MPKKNIAAFSSVLIHIILPLIFLCGCTSGDKKTEADATAGDPVFRKVNSSSSGLTFANVVEENYTRNYFDTFAYVYNGAGVAVADINNDGLSDICSKTSLQLLPWMVEAVGTMARR